MENYIEDNQRPIMNELEDLFNDFIEEELQTLDDQQIQVDYQDKEMTDEEFEQYEQRIDFVNEEIKKQKEKLFTEFSRDFYFGVRQIVLDIQNQIPRRVKEVIEKINLDNQ